VTTIAKLTHEFEHEVATTRRFLERLPSEKFDWRPHQKSMSARELAGHLVECAGYAEPIFAANELDFDPKTYKPILPASVAELVAALDERAAAGVRAMNAATEKDLERPWQFKIMGRVRLERPKDAALRDFTLSHLIHHRGQFSVYLRLLDVPVPGAYGPSADEGM
jgi:uncharacterized damage-inducible protein DinB